jgi:ABC-type spermidine/putrescine transport system permease subunit I
MNSTDLFALLWMLPFALMAGLVIRQHYRRFKRRQATAFNDRLMRYHDRLNSQRHLFTRRGESLLEALAALAFCLVISALMILLLACNDAQDIATLINP